MGILRVHCPLTCGRSLRVTSRLFLRGRPFDVPRPLRSLVVPLVNRYFFLPRCVSPQYQTSVPPPSKVVNRVGQTRRVKSRLVAKSSLRLVGESTGEKNSEPRVCYQTRVEVVVTRGPSNHLYVSESGVTSGTLSLRRRAGLVVRWVYVSFRVLRD